MLLAALPIRSAPARIATRSARSLTSSPLRTPLSDRQQPYRLRTAATAAGSDTATMPGIRTVKQVGVCIGCGNELKTMTECRVSVRQMLLRVVPCQTGASCTFRLASLLPGVLAAER
jgi:hypothetical protein